MNRTLPTPTSVSIAMRLRVSHQADKLALLIAVTACVLMLLTSVFRRETYTGDEGFYGVTALNMVQSPEYVVRPSFFPAGHFAEDKHGFAHPPFNSAFYAVALWLTGGSRVGPEVLNALNFAVLLFLMYRIVVMLCQGRSSVEGAAPVPFFVGRAALFSVLLLAASPPMIGYFAMLEAEPLMTTFGLMAIYSVLRGGFERGQRLWLFLAGLLLGMAFGLKLWLFGPLALAVCAALVVRMVQERLTPARYVAGLGVLAIGVVVPAGLHLAIIAVFSPSDLDFWLRNVYFGIFTNAGISGSKLGGSATPANWVHPVWYYGAALYRDHFFLLPAIAFGGSPLLREVFGWRVTRARVPGAVSEYGTVGSLAAPVLVFVVGLAGVAPLSLLKVKEPLYVLACAVFLYPLAGVCLAVLVRRFAAQRGLDRFSLWAGTMVVGGLLVLVSAAYLRGLRREDVTAPFALAHTLTFGFSLAAVHWAHRRKREARFTRWVCAGCAVAVVAGFSWIWISRGPRDAAIARVIAPYVSQNEPEVLSFIASNFKGFQYLTYRRGMYWHEIPEGRTPDDLQALPEYGQVRAFVFGPEDLAKERNEPWLVWLTRHAEDKTREVDRELGKVSGYRVFVKH